MEYCIVTLVSSIFVNFFLIDDMDRACGWKVVLMCNVFFTLLFTTVYYGIKNIIFLNM